MKTTLAVTALTALLATPAFAQWPEGTPLEERGSRPSPMGNPTPQQELETHVNEQGEVVTEGGRKVKTMPRENVEPGQSVKHSAPGGPIDESTDAGKLD